MESKGVENEVKSVFFNVIVNVMCGNCDNCGIEYVKKVSW